jgi:hypothetical protein
MNDTVLPGAAGRATALFTDWIEGHYDQVVAGFDATMTARLPVSQLTAFAAGQMKGRVSYNTEGQVSGLFIVTPETP